MSSITLVGHISKLYEGAEQRYAVVKPYKGQWVIVEYGYKRWGPGMDLVYECEYNPDEEENQNGWNLINGYHSVYRDEVQYLEDCAIPSEEIIDGLPCPSWAVACLLN